MRRQQADAVLRDELGAGSDARRRDGQFLLVGGLWTIAAVLWIAGIVLWAGLTYGIFTALTVKPLKPGLAEGRVTDAFFEPLSEDELAAWQQ